jgi:hypothetical protein
MPVIDEFYVIAESGVCYYSKSREKEIDQTLFAGFLTALNSLSQQVTSEEMSSIILQNRKYTISKIEGLLFIARTDPKKKESEIRKELEEMQSIFLENYSPSALIKTWDGDVTMFKNLDPQYDKFFIESAAKRMASLF